MPTTPFNGRYSHKEAAHKAGLGNIGKNDLFLHKKYGARVRLGTLFTDCELHGDGISEDNPCINCDKCVKACPSGAILGVSFENAKLMNEAGANIFVAGSALFKQEDYVKAVAELRAAAN